MSQCFDKQISFRTFRLINFLRKNCSRHNALKAVLYASCSFLMLILTGFGAIAQEATPSISPSYKVFSSGPQAVTITDTDSSAVLHYTVDGTQPSASSPVYSSSFNVSATTTVNAIAIGTSGTSGVATSTVQIDPTTASVPRTNLLLWNKADNGVVTSGSNVSGWYDVSGNGYNSGAGNTPTFVTNAINGYPAVNFTGNEWFYVPSGFSTLGPGATVFVACKPTSTSAGGLINLGNSSATDTLELGETAGAGFSLNASNGSTNSTVTAPSSLNLTGFQVLEGLHNGAGVGTLYKTGTALAQNLAMQNLNNVSRGQNYLARDSASNLFVGQIAEILCYSAPLSSSDKLAVESYLWNRYLSPPVISPNVGVFATSQTVTITGSGIGTLKYTLDGSAVTSSSPSYTTPFAITSSTTINAAEFFNGAQSGTTTVFLQRDDSTANVPRSGLMVWQKADYGITTSGTSVTNWTDVSGNGLPLSTRTGYTNPTLRTSVVNGLPVVSFDGATTGLQWPSGFSDLTAGCSLIISCRPINNTSGLIASFGNSYIDILGVWTNWAPGAPVYYDASNSKFYSTYNTNQFQNMAFVQNATGTVTYYNNGNLLGQSNAMTNFTNVLRTQNYMGGNGYASYFNGDIPEIMLYNRPISASELANISNYLATRYLGPSAGAPAAPIFSLAAGTLTAPTQLGISGAIGSTVRYTVDGTTPNSSSTLLTAPLQINYSQTVKAISIVSGVSSAVSTAAYTLDTTRYPAPNASDTSVMQINLQQPSFAQ